jgi:hypothetical protein
LSGDKERPVKRLAALAFALLFPAFGWAQYNSFAAYAAGKAPSYAGLWWNAAESGWGVSIAHQGDILFAVWYTYDHDGTPMWLVMPDAQLTNDEMEGPMGMMDMEMMGMITNPPIYTGTLYRSHGPAFSSATFDAKAVGVSEVGNATFLFTSASTGVFAYTVGGVGGSKTITRLAFAPSMPTCSLGAAAGAKANYQDLWWNAAESGWGVNIAHQGDVLFATWYTYDASGKGLWLVASNVSKTGASSYSGSVYRASGPAYDAKWDTSKVKLAEVGQATFAFDASGRGTFSYSVDGVTQAKQISRMAFSLPASVCR